jgi:hypothetical protein
MVQIIEGNERSYLDSLLGGALRGSQQFNQLAPYFDQKQQQQQQKQAAGKLFGEELAGLNPELQKELLRNQAGTFKDKISPQDYDTLKGAFGQKFADLYKSAPTGGRTKLLENAIDAKSRGQNIQDLLEEPTQKPKFDKESEEFPDFSKKPLGYTQSEWNKEKANWRKENQPIFKANKEKLATHKRDVLEIHRLKKLSPKLPEGLERTLINPSTGEFYGIAQLAGSASPEAQEWQKIISRFQNRAKDSFGSRVTNFDLVSFMKQFPSMLNTEKGRGRILDLMETVNDIDQLYEDELDSVYKRYNLNGISQEKADEIVQSRISAPMEKLINKYENINMEAQNEGQGALSGQMVEVIGPDGKEYEVDLFEVEQLPKGFRLK